MRANTVPKADQPKSEPEETGSIESGLAHRSELWEADYDWQRRSKTVVYSGKKDRYVAARKPLTD